MYRLRSRLRSSCAVLSIATLLAPSLPLMANSRKGDRLVSEARIAETKENWDKALTLAQQAVMQDPADPSYQLEIRRVRFEAANFHLQKGQQIREKGQLNEALAEFERAYQIDPASDIAEQEVRRTRLMIEREKKRALDPNSKASPEEASLTPAQEAQREVQQNVDSLLPVPELRPLNAQPLTLRMNNQKPKILFETVGNVAGINVLFDPDFDQAASKNQSIDLTGATIKEALDYLAVVTHAFWKPLSSNTIFVTTESPTKRHEYEDQEIRVFYLSNITKAQELQEVITTLRQVVEVSKLFNYTAQNAIIVKAEPDKMALVEKIIGDLDKPRSEVLIDVMVMEVDSTKTRQLAAAFAPTGITSSILFTPRSTIQTLASSLGTTTSSTSTTGTFTTTGSTTSTTSTTSSTTSTTGSNSIVSSIGSTGSTSTSTSNIPIPLTNLHSINGNDFSLSNVPSGLLEAVMSDSGTRVLQRPQIRAIDNEKATLKIGDRIPTASGSYSPGVGSVGVNALVNTQFTYIDTGVNLEMTPRVHDNQEVSLHVDVDISQVSSYNNLGGISQPVISQRKATLDVRMRDGQINIIGGLIQIQDSKTTTGVPGLASIPIIGRLFSGEQTERDRTELLIALVPHIVRGPDLTSENLRTVYAGNATNYAVRRTPATGADQTPLPTGETGNAPALIPQNTPPTGPTPSSPIGPPPAIPAGRVSFVPAIIQAQQGASFTTSIRVEGAVNLQSIESQLKFDPKILRINSITAGDLLQQNGVALEPRKNILNDSGDASATLSRDPSKGPVNGAGSLLTITFQAIARGSTLVTMPKTVLHDASGNVINAGSAPLSVMVK